MSTLERHGTEHPSSFRAAFADARREMISRGVPGSAAASERDADRSFEVRIEKRRGRRADTTRWNKLGCDGWELVTVTGKHAYFRRERPL